jgi:hypothetical protein
MLNVTTFWLFSPIVLIIFLALRGWNALPTWQKRYVQLGLPFLVLLIAEDVATRYGLGMPNLPDFFLPPLAIAYIVAIWWGVIVGANQVWLLLKLAAKRSRTSN